MKKICFPLFVLAAVLLFTGCARSQTVPQTTTEPVQTEEQARYLTLSVQQDKEASQYFRPEELGGNFQHGMQYRRVKDVTITMDGETIPLETALAKGEITEEDIFYYARKDARNGICKTEAKSLRGVSNFYFHYPEYSLKIIYDVHETPDGSQYVISQLHVYALRMFGEGFLHMDPTTHFFDPETGAYLDREDWGLTFEVQKVSPTSISVTCTQSGGQQIGNLSIAFYCLSNASGAGRLNLEGTYGDDSMEAISVNMEGMTTFSIDWTECYGSLPKGDYYLDLDIYDLFEPEQVPPLSADFHDWQGYSIPFTVSDG